VPAATARAENGLPIGLAHDVRLTRPVAAGERLRLADVAIDADHPLLRLRAMLTPG